MWSYAEKFSLICEWIMENENVKLVFGKED
jgi:hypothetical protein